MMTIRTRAKDRVMNRGSFYLDISRKIDTNNVKILEIGRFKDESSNIEGIHLCNFIFDYLVLHI